MAEIKFLISLMSFYAFLLFLFQFTDIPDDMKFFSGWDFAWFGGGIIGVASACVVWSGVPCAAALAVFGLGTLWSYVVVSFEWLKILIFTPLLIGTVYVISKLGRGGG